MKIESPIYLAASYSRRLEMQEYAVQLEALGYQIGAEWVTQGHDMPILATTQQMLTLQQRWAVGDYHDVYNARTVINFTDKVDARKRGGRHVEFGLALGISGMLGQVPFKTLVLIGPCENIFHTLPIVQRFDTWEDFLAEAVAQRSKK